MSKPNLTELKYVWLDIEVPKHIKPRMDDPNVTWYEYGGEHYSIRNFEKLEVVGTDGKYSVVVLTKHGHTIELAFLPGMMGWET